MKRAMFASLVLFFIAACNKAPENIVRPEQQPETQVELKELSPKIIAILDAAEKDTPIDKSNGVGIGVLDRDQSSTQCLVGYYNENIYEVYRFTLLGNSWTRGERLERYDLVKPSLGKTSAYTKKIADLYYGFPGSQPRDAWYVPGNQVSTGTWTYEEEYVTNKPTMGDFYNGTDVNNGKEWSVSFSKWEWWIYSLPSQPINYQYGTYSGLTAYFEIFYNGDYYRGADKVKATYQLTVIDVTSPSTPNLSSPSNGAWVDPTVTFAWSASSGTQPITYQLQVDDQSAFSSPSYNQSGISGTSRTVSGLSVNTTYYWRVRASNNYPPPSDWSEVWSIFVKPSGPPPPPTIFSSPYQNHPGISWDAVPQAAGYKIYRGIGSPPGSYGLLDSITTTSYVDYSFTIFTGNGEKMDVYYKVKAYNVLGDSPYSNFYKFTCVALD